WMRTWLFSQQEGFMTTNAVRFFTAGMALCLFFAIVISQSHIAPTATTQAAPNSRVLSYLTSISGSKIVAGQHNREPNSNPAQWTNAIYGTTGVYPGLWSGDFLFEQDNINNRWTMIDEAKRQWNQ